MLFLIDGFTRLLNQWFGGAVVALLSLVHIRPAQPASPITNAQAEELIVFGILVLFFILVRAQLSVEKPGTLQVIAEGIYEFVDGQGSDVIGHGYKPHMALGATILMFVLGCNLMGILPGLVTPTASPEVPLGLAMVVFVYYHAIGLRANGIGGYFKHFLGPIWWMAWFMLPLEIISHLARILSLTVRLYANMFASDLLTLVFFSLVPIGIPILFLALHFGVAIIQAYVFMLLMMIYVGTAAAHDDVEGAV